MPRDGSGIYSTPPGTHGTPNTTILSAAYNNNVDDVAVDLNTPRPIVAGGTGATTPAGAVTALGAVAKAGDTMTGNLTTSGSFISHTQIQTDRNNNTGYIYFGNSGNQYIGFDGTNYTTATGSGFIFGGAIHAAGGIASSTTISNTAGGADFAGKVWHRGSNAGDWGSQFTAPGYGLSVQAGTGSGDYSFQVNNAANSITYFSVRGDGAVQSWGSITIGVNGYLYLGNNSYGPWNGRINVNSSPGSSIYGITFRADTDANAAQCLFANAAGGGVGSITTSAGGTAFNTSSDERLKEGFETFDAGRIVDDTEVWSFKWKSSGERSYGVSAQQAQQVYPEAVTYLDEQDWYGIDYSKYVPVLLQELKALRARVAALEGGVDIKPSRQ